MKADWPVWKQAFHQSRLRQGKLPRTIGALLRCEAGNSLITFALALPLLVAALGLGIDSAATYLFADRLQHAADEAALSAAQASSSSNTSGPTQIATIIATKYGFSTSANTTVTVNKPPATGPNAGDTNYLEVLLKQTRPRYFTSAFSTASMTISARAVVRLSSSTCVMALNTSTNKAVNTSGSALINLQNCDLQDNSASTDALDVSGGAQIIANNVKVVGKGVLSGGGTVQVTGQFTQGASALADPYATSTIPSYSGCNATNYSTNSYQVLSPGVYCGGLTISSGGNVTLNPGVYIIDRGSLTVSGGGTLSGTGVTIILTSSTGSSYGGVTFSGSSVVSLSAPTSGSTAGLTIFGDRRMPTNTKFAFSGGSQQSLDGAVYVPSGALNWSGGSSNSSTNCTVLIGNTVTFSGGSSLTTQGCSKYGASPSGYSLVE